MSYWGRYILVTWTYGAVSTVPHLWRAERKYTHTENRVTQVLPMPLADRYGNMIFRMCTAPLYWPFFLHRDLTRLELYCKGIDPRKYGIDPDEDLF